jgi:hypothetical protein
MKKREKLMKIGTKIIGNYGAMIPLWYGEVVAVETFDIGCCWSEAKIRWDNGSTTSVVTTEIIERLPDGSTNAAVGSPIGIYTEEAYYNA